MTDKIDKSKFASGGTRRGNGAGHGAAKAPFVRKPPRKFQPGDDVETRASNFNGDPAAQVYRTEQRSKSRARRERLDELADRAVDALEQMMADPAHPKRFDAARDVLNRADGMPVQPTLNANVDDVSKLSDHELAAELARLERETAKALAGSAREAVPGES